MSALSPIWTPWQIPEWLRRKPRPRKRTARPEAVCPVHGLPVDPSRYAMGGINTRKCCCVTGCTACAVSQPTMTMTLSGTTLCSCSSLPCLTGSSTCSTSFSGGTNVDGSYCMTRTDLAGGPCLWTADFTSSVTCTYWHDVGCANTFGNDTSTTLRAQSSYITGQWQFHLYFVFTGFVNPLIVAYFAFATTTNSSNFCSGSSMSVTASNANATSSGCPGGSKSFGGGNTNVWGGC